MSDRAQREPYDKQIDRPPDSSPNLTPTQVETFKTPPAKDTSRSYLPTVDIVDSSRTVTRPPGAADDTAGMQKLVAGSGASIMSDQSGTKKIVARTDGSAVTVEHDASGPSRITETKDGAKPVIWQKQGDTWTSDANPPGTRKDMQLQPNGNLTFEDSAGIKHTISGRGADFAEREGQAKVGFDNEGRISDISYADGKIRRFGYSGKENQPSSMTSFDPATNQWSQFSKTGSHEWSRTDAQGYLISKWSGQINVSDRGAYSTRDGGMDSNADRPWVVHRIDGSHSREKISGTGAVSTYDAKDRLLTAEPADKKYKLSAELDEKGNTKAITWRDSASGESVVWKPDASGKVWHSDSAKYKEERRDVHFDAEGQLRFTDDKGRSCYQKPDGNTVVRAPEGVLIEKNADGQVVRTQNRNGDYQTFKYENGSPSEITQVKNGKSETWNLKDNSRIGVIVGPNGEIGYQRADGGQALIGPDLRQTDFTAAGKVEAISFPNGSSRKFEYDDQGKLRSFTDALGGQGAESRTWSAALDAQGNPTDKFSATLPNGRTLTRDSVNLNDTTGDIEYKTKDGQLRISKSSDLAGITDKTMPSTDLEESRDAFRAEAKKHGVQMEPLNEFIDAFEKRCQEARTGGLKAPSDEQIAKTYDTFRQMLTESSSRGGLTEQERAVMVKLAMHNIAYPRRIDQGANPTCNVTTTEIFTASRHPENYARVIKDLSLTGSFQVEGGPRVTPPAGALRPGAEECAFRVENDKANGWRNWASQMYQVGVINSVTPFLKPTQYRPNWGKPYVSGSPDMALDEIQQACKNVNGHKMPYFGNQHTPSAEELLKLKEQGQFPVGIHTIHVQDANRNVSGLHVQTIHDVRIQNGQMQVLLDNQHGESADAGWIDLSKLYQAQQLMATPGIDRVTPQMGVRMRDLLTHR